MGDKQPAVPLEMVQAMLPTAAALGHNAEESDRIVAKVDLGTPLREMAIRLGQLLKNCGLYRMGASRMLVAQFGEEGWKEMTPHRFCGWAEKFVTLYVNARGQKGKNYEAEASMGKDLAAKILETDDFLIELPVIEHVSSVRLPLRMKDGSVKLMKRGYNEEHKIWCEDDVEFDEKLTLNDVLQFWPDMCGEFMFAEKGPRPADLFLNRSFLVHMAACVGAYCKFMFEPGTMLPSIIYTANDQGSGKLILVCMALSAPFGIVEVTTLPQGKGGGVNEEKLESLLETVARSRRPYLLLDDAPGGVFSHRLNAFVTAPAHTGREYGDNKTMFSEPNVTQVFITGNNVESSRDVMQRSLWCELFMVQDAESRKHVVDMTPAWVGREPQRKRFLGVLWAMFRQWIDEGMPESPTIKHRAPDWSKLVGGIMSACGIPIGTEEGMVDPFAVPDLPMAGVRSEDDVKALIVALADEAEADFNEWQADEDPEKGPLKDRTFNTADVIEKARDLQLLVEIVGSKDDKPLKGGELRKLGRRLGKWRGKEDFATSKGKRFRFGLRRQEHGSIYPIQWI